MTKTINCIEQPQNALESAKTTLLADGIVCVPTETVYGLVCLPTNTAIDKLAQIKGRPEDKPFALFVSSLERAKQEAIFFTPESEKLANNLWPGPLTLVMAADEHCVHQYKGSIGLRCPDYPFILDILNSMDGLLVNTSMNKSGNPPVWDLNESDQTIEEVDLIIDGGILSQLAPSTVVDCRSEKISILREGAISLKEIEAILQ